MKLKFFFFFQTSNKKGVSRSLLSATKRLFGSSKPGSPGSTPVNSVIYAFDAPELQLRRLGDLYFMFTNYSLAFQVCASRNQITKFLQSPKLSFKSINFYFYRRIIQQNVISVQIKHGNITQGLWKWRLFRRSCKAKFQKRGSITWKKQLSLI